MLIIGIIVAVLFIIAAAWYCAKKSASDEIKLEASIERGKILQETIDKQSTVYAAHPESVDALDRFMRQVISGKVPDTKLPLPK